MKRLLWMLLLLALAVSGCQKKPENTPEEALITEVAAVTVEEESAEAEDSLAGTGGEEAAVTVKDVVSGEKPEEPAVEDSPPEEPEEFVVTEELYNQTFDDIESIIAELSGLIQAKNYDLWLTYLTDEYIEETSKSAYLSKWIKDPDDQNLKTYFLEVVVSTRSKVKLDEIKFIDDASVYAYTVYKGEKYLLYYLVKTEDGWKVDFY